MSPRYYGIKKIVEMSRGEAEMREFIGKVEMHEHLLYDEMVEVSTALVK